MQLLRHGQLDDRRRRVLTEEVIGSSPAMAEPSGEPGSGASSNASRRRRSTHHARSYGDDVLIDQQARVTDLIPQRYSMLALVLAAGLTVVTGVEAAHFWLPELSRLTGGSRLTALDLSSDAALANWFSSTALGLAAAVSVVIYSVRRHRKDDYHGRYRLWLWAAALWAVMSVDEGASLHEGLSEVASHFGAQRGLGGGPIWWVSAYGLLFAAIGTRLFLEMRCCRLSSTSLAAAVGCFIASVVAKLGLVPALNGVYAVITEEGCEMVGDVLLLFSMLAHARYTILDAQGAIAPKAKKAKAARSEKPPAPEVKKGPAGKTDAAAPVKRSWFGRSAVDAAHASPPAPSQKTMESSKSNSKAAAAKPAARPSAEPDDDDAGHTRTARKQRPAEEDDYDYEVDRRLSKAERKAMRRQKDRPRGGE
ncbi:MAG TPA: hypothetical protein VFI31_22610 [Pirellulales bacterium]|nr:hypothetical protein [Pirellulales bacterium]